MVEAFRDRFTADYRDDHPRLRREALELLGRLDLVRTDGDALVVRPAMARYRAEVRLPDPVPTLFGVAGVRPESTMGDAARSEDSGAERWRPTRVGIRNIWEYDDQEFHFVDGRLILRGPNGSGKSNALALLVPFVFDAIMSSGRMDPFGGGRSMKTLLLSEQKEEGTGARFRRDQRTGYVWMELSRGDRYLIIGCGARASVQRDAEAWFFVTDRRPGKDLDLVPEGTPMTRAQLVEALGSDAVHDTAESYRDAVDRALFGSDPNATATWSTSCWSCAGPTWPASSTPRSSRPCSPRASLRSPTPWWPRWRPASRTSKR